MNLIKTLKHLGFEEKDFIINDNDFTIVNGQIPTEIELQNAWEEVQLKECDIRLLITEFLKDKNDLINFEHDSQNIVDGLIFSWDYVNIPRPSNEELLALEAQATAKLNNQVLKKEAEAFFKEADWKRMRHISQKALGITTSLSDEEYLAMETECQACREIL